MYYSSDWETDRDTPEGGNRWPEDHRFQHVFYPPDDKGDDNLQRAVASDGPTTKRPVTAGHSGTTKGELLTSHPEETTLFHHTSEAHEEVTTNENNIVTHSIFEEVGTTAESNIEFTTEEGNSITNSTVATGGGIIHTIATFLHVTDPVAILVLVHILILILIIVIVCLVCCCRRSRKKNKKTTKKHSGYVKLEPGDGNGDLCLSLMYVKAKQTLKITVLEAKKLQIDEQMNKKSALFVHVSVARDKKEIGSYSTQTQVNTANPYFNETFEVSIDESALKLLVIKASVFLSGPPSGMKKCIGICRVGTNGDGKISGHLREMVDKPNRAIAMWHMLLDAATEKEGELPGADKKGASTEKHKPGAAKKDIPHTRPKK